ncbi:HAD domain-containing protein [Thomasclavelia sp.]|uniref:HAD domain-containing protein n=1 Tax=Thomasclavelia sp. TaxID=3025757 RepID=UPI0025EA7443|nr:HAD domain-containing protein [Thomasclavelia sp.]
MHKSNQFINQARSREDFRIKNSKYNNIIFLDIDGVIQPPLFERRFAHDMDATAKYLSEKYNDDIYLTFDKYDLAAAYYDWSYIALGYLRELIENTNSKIVLHSAWGKYNTFDQIKALFRLYDLDMYIIDVINEDLNKEKCINKYLANHQDIDHYIIIDDDQYLLKSFGEYGCLTKDYFNQQHFNYCQSMLTKKIID